MVIMGVVRHKIDDFAAWKQKFDERMAIRKGNGWAGHELYYDENGKNAYVVHTVNDDKSIWRSSIWPSSKLWASVMR